MKSKSTILVGLAVEAAESLMLIADTNTIVVPGHGLVADRQALVQFHDMLQTIEGRILSLIKTRSTISEVIGASPTAEIRSGLGKRLCHGSSFHSNGISGTSA